MGGPNPKYQQFGGLWAVTIKYDHEVGADWVERIYPINSSAQYWRADIDRDTDIHSNEADARATEDRVTNKYEAAKEVRQADIHRRINETARWLEARYGNRPWFDGLSYQDIIEIAAHLTTLRDEAAEDELFVRQLFGSCKE